MFIPIEVEVPAAGKQKIVNSAGCSLVALLVPAVDNQSEAAKIFFSYSPSRKGPVLPYVVLNEQGRGFQNFTIEGTSATAGQKITFMLSDSIIEQSITLNPELLFSVEPGGTFAHASSDVAQALAPGEYTDADGNFAVAMTVTAEGNDIRVATGGTVPDQTANPNGLGKVIKAGGFRRVVGIGFISTFQWISAVGAAHASVNFDMEFKR